MKFAWPHTRVVSQPRPFLFHSAKHFQYAILKAISAVEWKGLACETTTRDNSWNYICVWQSQVEIKHSVAYFDHVAALKRRTLVKGRACT